MRRAIDKNAFTPFGLWIQEYVNEGFSVTNLDFVVEDYKNKRIQLIEEKQSGGKLHHAQALTIAVLDLALMKRCPMEGYDYWGFFMLVLPKGASMVGPGMTLNGFPITAEELQAHLNFERQHCEAWPFKHRRVEAAE